MMAIRQAFAYVSAHPLLRVVVGIAAVVGLIGFNFRVILPLLVTSGSSVGAMAFGLLYAAFGAGAISGSLIAANAQATSRSLLAGMAAFSVTMLALSAIPALPFLLILLFVLGLSFSVWLAATQ